MKRMFLSVLAMILVSGMSFAQNTLQRGGNIITALTPATIQTADGKTIRIYIHPDDADKFKNVQQGESVKMYSVSPDVTAADDDIR